MVRPILVEKEHLDNGDGDVNFGGIYDVISLPTVLPGAGTKLDLYRLLLNRNTRPANAHKIPNVGAIGVDTVT